MSEYPHLFDEPWQVHPDIDTPINDLPPNDDEPFEWEQED